jgi:hypothetical protein
MAEKDSKKAEIRFIGNQPFFVKSVLEKGALQSVPLV